MMSSSGQSKLKKKHFRVKHQKVKLFRANEPFLSVFMWGINHTINELMHVTIPVMLLPDDFRAYSKIKIDNHLFNKSQPLPDDSAGKSGAKFYQSYDKLFIIKTLTSEEVERMHSFLKHYHPYIVERHGKTLLPQYLGMYRLTVDNGEHYIVVMRNVFSNHLSTHRKFDLKGSTVDREASEKEREKELPTFKDNDFVNDQMKVYIGEEAKAKLMETLTADVDFLTKLHLMDYSLLLGIHEVERGEEELQRQRELEAENPPDSDDSESGSGLENRVGQMGFNTPPDSPNAVSHYLREHSLQYEGKLSKIYQYISTVSGGIIPELDIYAIPSCELAPVKEIYFVAIIDVLTHYGVKKQAAKAAKTVKYGSNVDGISTCDPEQYAKRFIDFIGKAIE
ncbi:phosphatidylinositol 5-phosphate 4-kinase type-2 alpha isoform X3 [Euwallacea fornicatus]|uniref:phosphatidylinositol 5-phosphate 4-kinase type-2 alpha isoform X3 n=1 Tax=Euwallacea fornicatus TaxID=995702 RepID=UPI0033907190